jgi:hypothetical protein
MIDRPVATGISPMKPPVASARSSGWSRDARNAPSTYAGSGTTTTASHSSRRRSSPRDRRNRTSSDTPASTSPVPVSTPRPVRTTPSGPRNPFGRANGLRTPANGGSSPSGQTSAVQNHRAPATTVSRASRPHRDDSGRRVEPGWRSPLVLRRRTPVHPPAAWRISAGPCGSTVTTTRPSWRRAPGRHCFG